MIGVKIGELAVVEHLVENTKTADILDQLVLLLCLSLASDLGVDVAQGGCVVRHRQDSDRLLVEIDRFVVSFLRPAQLRQTG